MSCTFSRKQNQLLYSIPIPSNHHLKKTRQGVRYTKSKYHTFVRRKLGQTDRPNKSPFYNKQRVGITHSNQDPCNVRLTV